MASPLCSAQIQGMTERRFNDDEVAAIFARAADEREPNGVSRVPAAEGMSLAELVEIGREVGIDAQSIEAAAITLNGPRGGVTRTLLGAPLSVGHTVQLGRELNDAEWERLVVILRDTFGARGNVRVQGGLRQWTNGNLQALLEPVEGGQRLRLRTTKGDARSAILAGAVMTLTSAGALVLVMGEPAMNHAASGGALLAIGMSGMLMIGMQLRALPGWARRRLEQMESVAARVAGRMTGEGRLGSGAVRPAGEGDG